MQRNNWAGAHWCKSPIARPAPANKCLRCVAPESCYRISPLPPPGEFEWSVCAQNTKLSLWCHWKSATLPTGAAALQNNWRLLNHCKKRRAGVESVRLMTHWLTWCMSECWRSLPRRSAREGNREPARCRTLFVCPAPNLEMGKANGRSDDSFQAASGQKINSLPADGKSSSTYIFWLNGVWIIENGIGKKDIFTRSCRVIGFWCKWFSRLFLAHWLLMCWCRRISTVFY